MDSHSVDGTTGGNTYYGRLVRAMVLGALESTEVSAVPAVMFGEKTSVEETPVAVHGIATLATSTCPFAILVARSPLPLGSAKKRLTRLLKLGLLTTDAVVSQRKASKELSQLMRLDLMLSDTAVSQNEPAKELTRL